MMRSCMPHNATVQVQREALARPNANKSQWAQSSATNLARQISIMEDAWGSR